MPERTPADLDALQEQIEATIHQRHCVAYTHEGRNAQCERIARDTVPLVAAYAAQVRADALDQAVIDCAAAIDAARLEALAPVLALHKPGEGFSDSFWCDECCLSWPCPTARAAGVAEPGEESLRRGLEQAARGEITRRSFAEPGEDGARCRECGKPLIALDEQLSGHHIDCAGAGAWMHSRGGDHD